MGSPSEIPRDLTDKNFDEILAQLELDEKEDAPLVTPVDYGHLRGLAPQKVYYRIRKGQLQTHLCPCGRKCIKKEDADAIFFPKPEGDEDETTE